MSTYIDNGGAMSCAEKMDVDTDWEGIIRSKSYMRRIAAHGKASVR